VVPVDAVVPIDAESATAESTRSRTKQRSAYSDDNVMLHSPQTKLI